MLTLSQHTEGVTVTGIMQFSTGTVFIHITARDVAEFVRSITATILPEFGEIRTDLHTDFIGVEVRQRGRATATYLIRGE